MTRNVRLPFWVIFILLQFGCATDRMNLHKYNNSFSIGYYDAANKIAQSCIDTKNSHKSLLWSLQFASTQLLLGNEDACIELLDQAEEAFKFYDLDSYLGKSGQYGVAMAVNDSFLPYEGKGYDRIMANVYKGMIFASMGDFDNARVEFNRTLQRQDEAKLRYAKNVARMRRDLEKIDQEANSKQKEEQTGCESSEDNQSEYDMADAETPRNVPIGEEEEAEQEPQFSVNDTLTSDDLRAEISDRYSNLDAFQAYPDFINPFATYVAGLFFLLEGDAEKAAGILKESYAMDRDNEVILRDFYDAESGKIPANQLWVLFENGLCPVLQEVRLDIPVFLATEKLKTVNIALPILKDRNEAYGNLMVKTGKKEIATHELCNMDRVIKTEFKKDFPLILAREVARQALKTYLQYLAQKEHGDTGGIGMAVFQTLTTAADTRSWTSLPKNIQVARVELPTEGCLTLSTGHGIDFTVDIPKCENAIVWVRIPQAGVRPFFTVIPF